MVALVVPAISTPEVVASAAWLTLRPTSWALAVIWVVAAATVTTICCSRVEASSALLDCAVVSSAPCRSVWPISVS